MKRRSVAGLVLAGSTLGIALSPGAIVFYTLGVFMDPVTTATGWSRGEVSFAASVFTSVLIFAIPVVGRLIDRCGVRVVLLPSIVFFGLALIAVGRATALWEFYLAFAALATLGAGANSVSYMRAVCGWFDRHRGLAIGVAQSGMGLGVMLMPAVAQVLLRKGGWSFAYQALGAIVLLVAFPAVACLVREDPESDRVRREQIGAGSEGGIELREAFRQPRFWILVLAFFLLAGAINSAALHLVPLVQAFAADRSTALLAASAFGGAMLVGRLVTGVLVDRYFAPYIAAILVGASTLALGALAWGIPGPFMVAAAFIIGLSAGSDGDLLSYLISRYFGMRSFATLSGFAFSAYLLATSLFPWLTGVAAERYGGYAVPLLMCAALGAGCVVAMLLFGQYCKPAPLVRPPLIPSEE